MERRVGAARLVFLVGRWAVKVPRPTTWRQFLWGLLCNMQEREFSRAAWPELCPVVASIPGGWCVVMQRAEVCTDETAPTEEEYLRMTHRPDYAVPAEWKPDSWGRLPDGRLVAIDYG